MGELLGLLSGTQVPARPRCSREPAQGSHADGRHLSSRSNRTPFVCRARTRLSLCVSVCAVSVSVTSLWFPPGIDPLAITAVHPSGRRTSPTLPPSFPKRTRTLSSTPQACALPRRQHPSPVAFPGRTPGSRDPRWPWEAQKREGPGWGQAGQGGAGGPWRSHGQRQEGEQGCRVRPGAAAC